MADNGNGKPGERPTAKLDLNDPREVFRLLNQRSVELQAAFLDLQRTQADAPTVAPADLWPALQRLADGQAVLMLALAHLVGQAQDTRVMVQGHRNGRQGLVLPPGVH